MNIIVGRVKFDSRINPSIPPHPAYGWRCSVLSNGEKLDFGSWSIFPSNGRDIGTSPISRNKKRKLAVKIRGIVKKQAIRYLTNREV